MGSLEDTIGQLEKDCQAARRDGIIHHREGLYPMRLPYSLSSAFASVNSLPFLWTVRSRRKEAGFHVTGCATTKKNREEAQKCWLSVG